MPTPFTDADLARIAAALGVEPVREGGTVRFALAHEPSGRRLAVEVMPEVALPEGAGGAGETTALVSVYGTNAFLQLQGVTGVVASEELGEVIFFAREGGRVDGLVVERQAGCSLYANVSEKLLSADFTRLPPEIMMSAVALSMSEPLFE
jgi:hypothetical protein